MAKKSAQSETVKEPGHQLSLDGRRFFPVGLNLEGRRVLVVGEGNDLIGCIQGVIEFGAAVDVVAERMSEELKDLAVAYSHRISILPVTLAEVLNGKVEFERYFLVFALSHVNSNNEKLTALSRNSGVLSTERTLRKHSDFAVPTWFRRGQIKISVATDGISGALELALITRIKAAFVREMDHYALFADFVIEKLQAARADLQGDDTALGDVVARLLECEDVCLALQRNNFDEASNLFDHDLKEAMAEQAEKDKVDSSL